MSDQTEEANLQIGKRIRDLRKRKGLTLQELADQVGISISYLSQIENGRVNLNISNLESISKMLGSPLVSLFTNEIQDSVSVVRSSERRWFALGELASESLLVTMRSKIEIFVIRLEPGSDTVKESIHQGEEFSYVIRGTVNVLLDEDQIYTLKEGDIIYYKSDIPHMWKNIGSDVAEVLVANTPATY